MTGVQTCALPICTLDPSIIARIAAEKARNHVTIEDAVTKIHEQMQEEQSQQAATQQQAMSPEGSPEMAMAPEMQPGMAVGPENPMVGAAPAAAAPPPDLASVLNSLRSPARQSPAELGLMQ